MNTDNGIVHKLPFFEEHRRTFERIKSGEKNIETRAGNPEYLRIREGDSIEFSCGEDKAVKQVRKVSHYKDLDVLFAAYPPQTINPELASVEEAKERYLSFPGYEQRIKEYGILVFELE